MNALTQYMTARRLSTQARPDMNAIRWNRAAEEVTNRRQQPAAPSGGNAILNQARGLRGPMDVRQEGILEDGTPYKVIPISAPVGPPISSFMLDPGRLEAQAMGRLRPIPEVDPGLRSIAANRVYHENHAPMQLGPYGTLGGSGDRLGRMRLLAMAEQGGRTSGSQSFDSAPKPWDPELMQRVIGERVNRVNPSPQTIEQNALWKRAQALDPNSPVYDPSHPEYTADGAARAAEYADRWRRTRYGRELAQRGIEIPEGATGIEMQKMAGRERLLADARRAQNRAAYGQMRRDRYMQQQGLYNTPTARMMLRQRMGAQQNQTANVPGLATLFRKGGVAESDRGTAIGQALDLVNSLPPQQAAGALQGMGVSIGDLEDALGENTPWLWDSDSTLRRRRRINDVMPFFGGNANSPTNRIEPSLDGMDRPGIY